MKVEDFAGTTPELLPEEYFAGETKAYGLFQDRFGTVRRQFTVDTLGRWDGEVLTLEEDFAYADGAKERRVWTIRKLGEGRYEGTAGDVVGVAHGRAAGNALNWRYDLRVPVGDRSWTLSFDDWMLLQPGGEVLMNVAEVSKFGVVVGRVTLTFTKPGPRSGV